MGKNYMAWKKEKKKKRKERKMMTISKDNKWMVLSLLKLKDNKLFPYGFGKFQSFIKFIRKDMRIKCRKVKFVTYQGGRSVLLSFDWTFVSFLNYVNPLYNRL